MRELGKSSEVVRGSVSRVEAGKEAPACLGKRGGVRTATGCLSREKLGGNPGAFRGLNKDLGQFPAICGLPIHIGDF